MPILVSDLRTRDVRPHWFEGVAVVQSISERILGAQPEDPRFPNLEEVRLNADGSVDIVADGPPQGSPVERAARALGVLVPESEMPVQLRLAVVTALSPAPRWTTLADFYEALAFFERPDRRAQVAALYTRWQASPLLEAPAPAPVLAPPASKDQPAARRSTRRGVVPAVAAGAVGLVAIAAALLWPNPGATQGNPSAAGRLRSAVGSALGTVRDTVSAGVTALGRQAGLAAPEPTPSPEPERPAPATAPRVGRPLRALPAVPLSKNNGLDLADFAPLPVPTTPVASLALEDDLPPTPPAAEQPAAPRVYTASDHDVTPPVLLRPQLPSLPPPGVAWTDLPVMEVLVDPDGGVITARLRTPPRRVQDSMLLSAVKAWVFQPAVKDGRTVNYRMLLWITLP